MANIIDVNLVEVQKYMDIPADIDFTNRVKPHIDNANRIDLKEFLGIEFYNQVIKKVDDADAVFLALINGETYTNKNDIDIVYEGFAPIIANYALARFYKKQQINVTRLGLVKKKNEFSDPISKDEIDDIILDAKLQAKTYQKEALNYLKDHREQFPVYWGDFRTAKTVQPGIRVHSSSKAPGRFDGFPNRDI